MSLKKLLNQFVSSNPSLLEQGKRAISTLNSGDGKRSSSKLSGVSKGVMGGSALAMLLSKRARKVGGKVLVVGGTIGLGALAYKAYQNYQKNQDSSQKAEVVPEGEFLAHTVSDDDVIILRAMIAAAKADGHVDEEERAKIEEAVAALNNGGDLQKLVQTELNKPLDPTEIARLAKTPEVKSQVYLASLVVVDQQNFMEKVYLQELSKLLDLEPGLVKELEAQVDNS